jgi:hypothetical protein
VLTAEEVRRFIEDGFVYLPEAFPPAPADECGAFLWRETGLDPDDPATWKEPVIRLGGYGGDLFNAAANTPALHEASPLPPPDLRRRRAPVIHRGPTRGTGVSPVP